MNYFRTLFRDCLSVASHRVNTTLTVASCKVSQLPLHLALHQSAPQDASIKIIEPVTIMKIFH